MDTPLKVNMKYHHEKNDLLLDPTAFHQLVESLDYLMITFHDISFTIWQVSQFMQSSCHIHLASIHHVIQYLRGFPSHELFFPTCISLRFIEFSDVDWAGCLNTHCSVTGLCMFLDESLIF